MDDMIQRDGFWWPTADDWCWRVIHSELEDLDLAISFARARDVAVQAGGNVGVWAAHLAQVFRAVETAEPCAANYQCLMRNVPNHVRHRQAAFGDATARAGMVLVPGNGGAHYLGGAGDIDVITIDSLALDACDLISLDVEGYEPMALRGAERTIRRFRPAIMFEEKGLSSRYYGIPVDTAERWVLGLGLGYAVKARVRKDVILAV